MPVTAIARRAPVPAAILLLVLSALVPGGGPAADPPAASASPTPAGVPAAATAGAVDLTRDREAIFDAFYKTGLDTTKAYAVSGLAIKKDNMTLLLKQGTVFLMQPIAGEITGLVFVGEGTASMTPPNRAQRFLLKKLSGSETLQEPFTEAVFRFSDGTEKLIVGSGRLDPAGAPQTSRAGEILKERNAWLDWTRTFSFEMQFLENRISGLSGRDFFYAAFHTKTHDWLNYIYDPVMVHENLLAASESLGTTKSRAYLVPWAEYHRKEDYDAGGHYVRSNPVGGAIPIRVDHVEMALDLPTTKMVEWDARLRIVPSVAGLRCLLFDLDSNADFSARWDENLRPVRVLSVADEAGHDLLYLHRRDRLLVVLPSPAGRDAPLTLRVRGTAEVIYQVTAESYGLLENDWYPSSGAYWGRSTFDWTVRVKKPYLITGSGRIVREFEDKDGDMNGIQLRCDQRVSFPWVIFGRFQRASSTFTSDETGKSTPLTIHSFPYMTFSITDPDVLEEYGFSRPVSGELTAPPKKTEGIFEEGKQVLKLYEKIYGPYPYDELHVAQMAPFLGFGQALQGFVQLTGEAFMSQASLESDFFHGFLAHEFAHQWWGHQIGPATPDDEWLSESFAEYASGIFVKEYQGAKRFQRTLETWKKRAKLSDAEAPIAAANGLGGVHGYRHRTNLLYYKGPYVLHMLRVMLDDEKYMQAMRALQQTYQNQNITTEMLLREINRVTGSDYSFFFDQWFWGTGIPTFRYSWRSDRQEDGRFLVTIRVTQDDKTNLKKVLMPIHLRVKGKSVPVQYKPVVQADQEIKLLMPIKPDDVTLDDDHVLLADIYKAN